MKVKQRSSNCVYVDVVLVSEVLFCWTFRVVARHADLDTELQTTTKTDSNQHLSIKIIQIKRRVRILLK